MPDKRIITLTTDFGYEDPFVGVMKGVILKINPGAEIIDLTHGIRPQDILEAALTIGLNYKYFPDNTIHVVVVDPGVGSGRRPVLVECDRHFFIGPDNGVFSYIFKKEHDILDVIHITSEHYFLSTKSPTFQGRDFFAPAAAWFSKGVNMSSFGERVTDYQTIDLPFPELTAEGTVTGEVIQIDRFGNAITNIAKADMERLEGAGAEAEYRIILGDRAVPLKDFYAQSADRSLCAVVNSSDNLEFFIYSGSASKEFSISIGDRVEISLIRK